MTNRQRNSALFSLWLCAYLVYLSVCTVAYWVSIEGQGIPLTMMAISLLLAALVGWLCIRANRQGVLVGLILAILVFAVMKGAQG